ncbi:hypothetical protein N9N67_09035, partial [Bacteriovoracaceae bacterium]|nr:hypothetical protein [Bacteriovoracaceae bacterium]
MKNLNSQDSQLINDFFVPIHELLREISQHFKIYIVGGFSRDFILSKTLSTDIDCELHFKDTPKDFLNSYIQFFEGIQKRFQIKQLNYHIFQIQIAQFQLEFSLPRKEKFDETIGHKNFEAEFFPSLPLHVAAQRRDFTFNAIYFLIQTQESKFSF